MTLLVILATATAGMLLVSPASVSAQAQNPHPGVPVYGAPGGDPTGQKCRYVNFEYTDGHTDHFLVCGQLATNDLTPNMNNSGLPLHVMKLHISCSDAFANGIFEKGDPRPSNPAGHPSANYQHLVTQWTIIHYSNYGQANQKIDKGPCGRVELPVYQCVGASAVTPTGATVEGRTNNVNATRAVFTFAPGGATFEDTSAVAAGNNRTFSVNATGLTPNTSYTVTVQFFAGATSLGTSAAGGCPFTTAPTPPVPAINVVKFVNGKDANTPAEGPFVQPGSQLLFRYVITNTGNTGLTNVRLSDDKLGALTCPQTTLTIGASMTCTATGPAPAAGAYANVATVVGTPTPGGPDVSDTDPAHAFVAEPAIDIIKFVNGVDADVAPGPTVVANSTLTFRFQVTNTGNVPLTAVSVTDQILAGGTGGVAVTCPSTALAIGAVMNCSGTGTAPASGQYTNLATVVGTGPPTTGQNGESIPGTQVTDDNPANVTVAPTVTAGPGIAIIKFVNDQDANNAPGVIVPAGSTLTFRYDVINTGAVPLTNVAVTDRIVAGGTGGVVVTCPKAVLNSGERMSCTGSGPAPAAGQYTNIGRVTGDPPSGPPVAAEDPANAFAQTPAVDIVKYVNGADANTAPGLEVAVGAELTWTYHVTNTGNVDLTNVTVVDDKGVAVDCGNGSHVIPLLPVSGTRICVGRGTATVAGLYTNIGTVTGTPPSGPPVTDSDPANHTAVAGVAPSVLPPLLPPDVTLPATGPSNGGMVWAAFGLLGLGAALLFITRRRRPIPT